VAVISSAHVVNSGVSSLSYSHSLDFTVMRSAASIKKNAEHTPPYYKPFSSLISLPSFQIFSFGVVITLFTNSNVAFLYSFSYSYLFFLFA